MKIALLAAGCGVAVAAVTAALVLTLSGGSSDESYSYDQFHADVMSKMSPSVSDGSSTGSYDPAQGKRMTDAQCRADAGTQLKQLFDASALDPDGVNAAVDKYCATIR